MTTLVLVHGCGNDRRFWDELLPHLGALEVYAPSLPGRGDTGGEAVQSAADAAAWVLTDLDARGIERAVVAGHSYGGGIAIELALQLRDRARPVLDGLVLVATGARLRVADPILAAVTAAVATGVPAELARWTFLPSTDPTLIERNEKNARNTPVESTRRDWVATNAFDRFNEVAEIRARTMVVGGTADTLTPPKYAQYLAGRIAGAQLEMVEGAGHMLPLEHPAELGARLRRFVASAPQ